jgi:hypothetical protein
MAIQFNDITAIGDVFEIQTLNPIIGIQTITGYSDVVLNETMNRFFVREFRYSLNAITYSEWIELTDLNLNDIFVTDSDIFDIQYRYTRSGTDYSGYLTFISIQLDGTIHDIPNPQIFTDLYFNKFFNYNDDTVIRWALNVLDKLYKKGIVANYVERETEGGNDEDYLAFFGALTHFMAILVRYAREFKDFTFNDVLLTEYLRQKGIFVSEGTSLSDLQDILQNVYLNFMYRGTNKMVSGELLRLIRKGATDEFIWGLLEPEKTIWNVNNNSPMYKGSKNAINLVKAYEYNEQIESLSIYPLIEDSFVSLYTDGSIDVMRILDVHALSYFPIDTIFSGIGDAKINDKLIVVDSRLSYEITFKVKQAILGDYFSMNIYLYDKDQNLLVDGLISAVDGTQTNSVIDSASLLKDDEYYFIRAIIFNENMSYNVKNVLDIGFGNHLIFNNSNAKYMEIELGSYVIGGGDWDGLNDLRIYDFKVRPLWMIADGFVMVSNTIVSFIENNSEQDNNTVLNNIKRFMIPYNCNLKNQFLDELTLPIGTPLKMVVLVQDETIIHSINGKITITASGGVQPYQYSIDNGSTFFDSNVFDNLAPGTYHIVTKDEEGTQVTETVVIAVGLSDLNFTAFVTLSSRLDISDAQIELIASGGTSPYFYSKNGIDYSSSPIFTGLIAGNYTMYVRDTDGTIVNKPVVVGSIRDKIVTVIVVDEENVPVQSVDVSVISEHYTTDVNGEAIIYLTSGSYDFSLIKIGYKSMIMTGVTVTSDRDVDVIIQTYYSLSFNVKDLLNVNLSGVLIETILAPIGQSLFSLTTDGSGNVIKDFIIAGDYQFRFSKSGFVIKVDNKTLVVTDSLDVVLSNSEFLFTTPGTFTWVVPSGYSRALVECIGAGGTGNGNSVNVHGGAGASYAASFVNVIPSESYKIIVALKTIGELGVNSLIYGLPSSFGTNILNIVSALGGQCATYTGAGLGSIAGCIGSIKFKGGNGDTFRIDTIAYSGAGGGAAGNLGNGYNASNPNGGNGNGLNSGKGAASTPQVFEAKGYNGINYGGGGSGAGGHITGHPNKEGGDGASGLVRITWIS